MLDKLFAIIAMRQQISAYFFHHENIEHRICLLPTTFLKRTILSSIFYLFLSHKIHEEISIVQ